MFVINLSLWRKILPSNVIEGTWAEWCLDYFACPTENLDGPDRIPHPSLKSGFTACSFIGSWWKSGYLNCQQVCVEVIDPQQHFADSRLPASLVQNEDLYLPDDIWCLYSPCRAVISSGLPNTACIIILVVNNFPLFWACYDMGG